MKKLYIYIILIATVSISSCKKSLEVQDPNAPTTTVFWKTADDANKGVNAIYSTIHRPGLCRYFFFLTIIRADEGWSTSPDNNVQNNFDLFINNDYNYGNYTVVYQDLYVGLNRTNQVLDNVPNIVMDATLKARYLGEAKFWRGYFLYQLAALWGNVAMPLTTQTTTSLLPTTPRDQVWAQAEKDFTDAAAVLPVAYTDINNDLGRVTKGAANAMLAKAYLQQRNFQAALQPLLAVIQSGIYKLTANYQDNFLSTTENNSESVFEYQNALNPNDNHDDDASLTQSPDNLNYGSSLPPFFAPRPIGFTDGQARRWPVAEFEVEKTTTGARDPRLATTFLFDSTDVRGPNFSLIYGQTFASRYGTNDADVWFRKFLNDNNGTATGDSFHSPNNYRFVRFADILLMYAECLNETSATAQAYQYVDQVRARAGLASLSAVMPGLAHDQFLAQLKHERITELTGEGHRWDDLARWGDLGTGLATRDAGFKNFIKGRNELLPIPTYDLDTDPALKQNPGY